MRLAMLVTRSATSTQPASTHCAGPRFSRALDTSILLAALCLLLSPDLGLLLSRAAALALTGSWLVLRSRELELRRLAGVAGVVGAAGLALILVADDAYTLAVGACLLLCTCGAVWVRGGASGASVAHGAALAGLLWTVHLASPALSGGVRQLWLAWSRGAGWIFGQKWSIGPTFQGAALLLPCAALLIARFVLVERRPLRLLACLGAFALWSIVHLWGLDLLVRHLPTHTLSLEPWLGVGLPSVLATSWWVSAPSRDVPVGARTRWGWASAGLACAALVVVLHSHVVAPRPSPRIGFYSANEGPLLNWERPRYGSYGGRSLGMFGLLPEQLLADGFEVSFLRGTLTRESLVGLDALVTINVNTAWTEDELVEVWEFVDDGGGLLVLGDHTDVGGSLSSQNNLLAPTGIEFQFDSAYPTSPRGWDASDSFFHQLTANLSAPGALQVSVGASLQLSGGAATPLLLGRHALGDIGVADAPQRAFLGDYAYQPGEQLGDCVLAAWSRLGAGRVLVFGDTSTFQNATIPVTYDPFLRDLFGWLTGVTSFDLGAAGAVAASVALLLFAMATVVLLSGSGARAGLVLLMMWCAYGASRWRVGTLLTRGELQLPQVVIDRSHLPRVEFGGDADRSLDGFVNAVTRSGYLPVEMEEFRAERLRRAELLLTVAPVMPYDAEELVALRQFMDDGGFILACASHPERAGLEALLELVGIEVLPRPIGPIPLNRKPGRVRQRVEFADAWQVGFEPTQGVEAPLVYSEFQGAPLATLSRLGKGGLFFVGDSRFFGAQNLESLDDYSEPNILFLRALLADLAQVRKESSQ